MIFLDTETVGLVGPIVLIQYAEDDGPVKLWDVWKKPVYGTLSLIEGICQDEICAFNLSFDWFHINKLYNCFKQARFKESYPDPQEIAQIMQSQPRQYCLKPKKALDLFLYLRKTHWQSLMARKDIRVRRVPAMMASKLAQMLELKIPFDSIFFYRRSEGYKWHVEQCKPDPHIDFRDVVLKFGASSGLKPIISEIFKIEVRDYPVPKEDQPEEDSFNPYDIRWLNKIQIHINHWSKSHARSYAEDDVLHLQRLYHYWNEPDADDLDSRLAVCVGCVRWRGFSVDTDAIKLRLVEHYKVLQDVQVNVNSSMQVLTWLRNSADDMQKIACTNTEEKTLEKLAEVYKDEFGQRAQYVIDIRHRLKEVNTLEKLLKIKRFCPDYKVIGTKSGRMAGGGELRVGGSLNPQGLQSATAFRSLFTLADSNELLSGGDFDSFEVTIAHAQSRDKNLEKVLKEGRKFHAELGTLLYGLTYEDVIDSDFYAPAKATVFAFLFGAAIQKMAQTAGIEEDKAAETYEKLAKEYPDLIGSREKIFDLFAAMQQPKGIGTAINYTKPQDSMPTLLGFHRYFTLENRVLKALYELANEGLPRIPAYVQRRERLQTVTGATQSALYAAAFNLQALNQRAAANHVIQGTGAYICKAVQAALWDMQPAGIHKWKVAPMNNHDEVIVVHNQDTQVIHHKVLQTVEYFRSVVPLLSIDWKENLKNWGDLK